MFVRGARYLHIYSIYVQEAKNKIREEYQGEIRNGENLEKIDMLRFDDDIAIVSDTEHEL